MSELDEVEALEASDFKERQPQASLSTRLLASSAASILGEFILLFMTRAED